MPAQASGRAGVKGIRAAGHAGDAPARRGGAGTPAFRRNQQKNRGPRDGGGATEALGLLKGWRARLADHRLEAAGACAFLDGPERVLRAVGLGKQQIGRVEAEGGQAVAVKRAEFAPREAAAHPQDGAAGGRKRRQEPQKPEAEAERCRHVGIRIARDLVKRAADQPAIGQGGIDLRHTETPRRGRGLRLACVRFRRGFERADLPAQRVEPPGAVTWLRGAPVRRFPRECGSGHAGENAPFGQRANVLFLFYINFAA